MEIWKIVPFANDYMVSDFGRIKKTKPTKKIKSLDGILSQRLSHLGYPTVMLNVGKKKTITVHRVVARAFLGDPPQGKEVNHIDGNKKNNNIKNIEYVTRSQNLKHAYLKNLRKRPRHNLNPNAKLNKEIVLEIRMKLSKGMSGVDAARMFNVTTSSIYYIKNKKTWN